MFKSNSLLLWLVITITEPAQKQLYGRHRAILGGFLGKAILSFACWKEIYIGALKTMSVDNESSFSSPPNSSARHFLLEIGGIKIAQKRVRTYVSKAILSNTL